MNGCQEGELFRYRIVSCNLIFRIENVTYTVSVKSQKDLSGYQLALNWDNEKDMLENIHSFSKEQGYLVNVQEGTLVLVWASEQEGTAFNEFDPALQLEFKNIDGKFSQETVKNRSAHHCLLFLSMPISMKSNTRLMMA
ncbi:MAG: hypothetical protein U5K79_19205 [Cyclobacteriaceae bacterium]|nr:hypothetical protein [Cyclobacteriaceae bacterium]